MEKDTKWIIGFLASLVIGVFLVFVAIEVVAGPIFAKSEMILNFLRSYKSPILFFVALFSVIDSYFLWFFRSSLKEDNKKDNYQIPHFQIPCDEM